MASQQGAVSAAAPLFNLSESATIPTTTSITQPEAELTRAKSLKRSRLDQSQNPANLASSIPQAGLKAAKSPKSSQFAGTFSTGFSAIPLTGSAALAEERRKREENQRNQPASMSENPGHKALTSLMAGGGAGMSRPQDVPVATTMMSEGMSVAANAITTSNSMQFGERSETSPASVTSLASLRSTAQTATASSTAVASPAAMSSAINADNRDTRTVMPNSLQASADELSNRALSFPGNVLAQQAPSRIPPRGMSLPMPGQNQQLAPRSPSQKKHKCPYCETEFTRHHNLKSHLLTHSQEKPYLCQTCNMRFRRLHDLKRHMKLHTGERPHICPKCDRKFARGDALARHSKGQGGCAGRRASMGSFGGDDDFEDNAGEGDDSGMDGIMYTNGTPQVNETEMSEEDRRRFSLPSIKAQHVTATGSQGTYGTHSRTPSTYPPTGPRPGQSTGGLYPPNTEGTGSSSTGTSPSMQNSGGSSLTPGTSILSTGSNSIYSQSAMTESPKPLSPGGMHSLQLGHDPSLTRQRSPSLTTQFQQAHFGRRQSGRSSPPGMSIPSPHNHGPKLPALSGLAPPDNRFTLPSQTTNQSGNANGSHSVQQGQPTPTGVSANPIYQAPGSGLGRGAAGAPSSNQGSGDSSSNLFAAGEPRVWAYVQTLEAQVKQLSDKVLAMESKEKSQEEIVGRLSDEITSLKTQLNTQVDAVIHKAPPAAKSKGTSYIEDQGTLTTAIYQICWLRTVHPIITSFAAILHLQQFVMAAQVSARLNAEPAQPDVRENQQLPPKSYADAVEKPALANGQHGVNGKNGDAGVIEKSKGIDHGSKPTQHMASVLRIVDTGEPRKEEERPHVARQESKPEYSAKVGLDDAPRSPARHKHRKSRSTEFRDRTSDTEQPKAKGVSHTNQADAKDSKENTAVFEKVTGNGINLVSLKTATGYEKQVRRDEKESSRLIKEESLVSGRQAGQRWHTSGIRFAPWNVPLQRRLQTLVVLFHTLSIVLAASIFFFLCAIPLFWPLLIPYMIYCMLSTASTSGALSHRSDFLRSLPVWSLFASYFPARLHRTQELPPTRKYIFGEGMGRAITIVVGGARESLDAQPYSLKLVLKRRKGFVKMALRTGADLVPVLAFGENDLYDQFQAEEHPGIHKFQLLVKKVLGFTIPLFHARGIFNYDVGLQPYRRPLNIVVGKPIKVAMSLKPEQSEIDRVHEEYVTELERLWDLWKDEFAPKRKEELQMVE
ncbi:hypothetical protein B7494_g1984 [Chlorociboria aeruginascens]|nr:hypothetical protein B7494_g1984 [Chlorociboria aeruginascens]